MGNNLKSHHSSFIQNEKINISDECKKEYFRQAKREFSQGIKKINSTIHSQNSNTEDSWVNYLLEKFKEYSILNKIENVYIQQILSYLKNSKESNEAKHVYNLSIYLSNNLDELDTSVCSLNHGLIEGFCLDQKLNIKNEKNISKDEMLWKGSEFIFKDLEDINHPINCFIRNLNFILTEVYEKQFYKLLEKLDKCAKNEECRNRFSFTNLESNHISIFQDNYESPCNILQTQVIFKESSKNLFDLSKNSSNNVDQSSNIENYILDFYKAMHNELLIFASYITNALIRFYSIKASTSSKFFDIYLEKIKDLMVRRDLYNLIVKIKSKIHAKKIEIYSENLIEYYNIKPYYLCTSPYFSMDKKFKKIIKKKLKSYNEISEKIFYQDKSTTKIKEGKQISALPFKNSILLLRQINHTDSIINKIDYMYKVRDSVLSEIDDFWKNIPLQSKYKSVDADNLLSLFIYLMIKAQINNLIIHLEIIEDFASRDLKLSRKGYFFNLFQSSIEYLVSNLSIKQLDINIFEYNNILTREMSNLANKPELILDLTLMNKQK